MKPILPMLFLLVSSVVNAQPKAAIYCKNVSGSSMKIYNATNERGHFECSDHLLTSVACYTGSRSEVIKLLNSGEFNWDEEWIAKAHYRGSYSIAYKFVDGPGEMEMDATIEQCPQNFFKNPAVGPFQVTKD